MLPLIETLSVTSFCFVYHTFSLQDSSQHSSYPHGICCNHLVTSLFYYFNTFSLQNSSWYYSHPHGIWWHLSFIIFILSAFKMALDIHMKIDGISWWHIFLSLSHFGLQNGSWYSSYPHWSWRHILVTFIYFFILSDFKMALDILLIHMEFGGISQWHLSFNTFILLALKMALDILHIHKGFCSVLD